MPERQNEVIFPPPLKAHGTIGIVSPGRCPDSSSLDKTKALLEARGYQVVIHAQNYLQDGQLAGDDAARAEAIMDMFADSTIDAVLCARGGTGSLRLLDKLDYEAIRQSPKPFIGFSDITVLLQALVKGAGVVAYHGPMGWNFANPDNDSRTLEDFFTIIGNRRKSFRAHYTGVDCVRVGKAEGVLVGGNLSLLEKLVGTPYDWTGSGAVLFIEDTDEPLYKIDNILRHLRYAGKFESVQAVLVGQMVNLSDGESGSPSPYDKPFGRDLREIILENIPPEAPVGFDFPCGHGGYTTTLPVGAPVSVTLNKNSVELSFHHATKTH